MALLLVIGDAVRPSACHLSLFSVSRLTCGCIAWMQTTRQLQAYSGLPMLGSGNQGSDGKFVKRCQKRMRDAGLERRMPGVIYQSELGLTAPCLSKAMRRHRRADHVVAALDLSLIHI